MRRSLLGKMILSYLAVALLTVLVVSVLIRLTSGRSLMSLVVEEQTSSLKELVQEYYTANNTLEGFFPYMLQVSHRPPPNEGNAQPPDFNPDVRPVRGLVGLVDTNYRAVIPTMGLDIGQIVPRNRIKRQIPVVVDGKTIAWILPDTNFEFKLSEEEILFLQRTTLAIGLAAVAGVLVALGIGYFLAGRLLKPIRQLTQASQALARGDLYQQVPVTSHDELGMLTATFNQMSADLVKADEQRKRMTSDITHDLSTPIQIIAGYIEMLEEGEVALSPQRIEIIKTELGNLRRLVGDLSTLSQVEGGGLDMQLEPVQPEVLLRHVYHAFQPIATRQGVQLELTIAAQTATVIADEGRLEQVLNNLLENALRYTLHSGTIVLGAAGSGPVQLWVQDSGEGIESEDLPYVFDRFYRADKARGANSGKMGLGLAICKALVEAQGGTIQAESPGKGLGTKMTITFDAEQSPK